MTMIKVPMPAEVQERIIRSAREAAPREICGFVLVTWHLVFMENVAKEEGRFAMDDEAQIDFHIEYRRQCIGMFHSHPEGRKEPSGVDAEYAPVGMRYWISTLTSVYEWDMEHEPPREVVNGRTRPAPILAASDAEGGASH
jgi:proteasome lid subunit RPN8/RPN11